MTTSPRGAPVRRRDAGGGRRRRPGTLRAYGTGPNCASQELQPGARGRNRVFRRPREAQLVTATRTIVVGNQSGAAMSATQSDAQQRAQEYARDADLRRAVGVLQAERDTILDRWLAVVAEQPFHHGRREHAVADHIPALFDAVVTTLERGAPLWLEPEAPLANPAVADAAHQHAAARSSQGLQPADVVLEFRLLRQEIWRALREQLSDRAPTGDLLAAQLLLNDALDGAMGVGLAYFVSPVEELKHEFLLTVTHDIRNPLTSLKGTAQLLARQMAEPSPNLDRVRGGLAKIDT